MPRPYIFAICEKVIFDKNDVPSLIGMFNKLGIAGTAEVPADAVAPKEWAVYTSWRVEPNDLNKNYVQVIRVLYPDGKQFGELGKIALMFSPEKKHSQTLVNSMGMPIGQNGPYTVETWLEEDGKRASDLLSTTFEIEVQKIEAGQAKT